MIRPLQARRPIPTDQLLALDRQLCFALYSTSLAMTKLYKPLLEELDLTYPQYLAMLALWGEDGLTVSQMGERLYLDSGTLTPLLKRLEAAGLVTRERSSEDERRVHVLLTPAGRRMRARAEKIPACILEASQCSIAEIGRLTRELHGLRERLAA